MYLKLSISDPITNNLKVIPTLLSNILSNITPHVLQILSSSISTTFCDMTPQYIINVDVDTTIILKLSNRSDLTTQNTYELTYSKEWLLIYKSLNIISSKSKESCLIISQNTNRKSRLHLKQRFGKFNLIIHVLMMLSHYFIDDVSVHTMSIFFESCDKSYCNIYSLSSSNTWNLCYLNFCGSERFMIQHDDESIYEIQKKALQQMSAQKKFKRSLLSHNNYEFKIIDRIHNNKFCSSEFITVYRNVQHDMLGIIAYSTHNYGNAELDDLIRETRYKVQGSSFFDAYVNKRFIFCSVPDDIRSEYIIWVDTNI